ncbi:putative alpha 1,3-glucanase, GH71 family [Bombardia bombarda]|uniref:Alpha 1,3-glucanase, GH71 family n=1 Tax=Bombardia bombarda TaxID=252184 RepID=A0AA40C861_9PEZI|nr:putative alpha 1,3-glucanase, GH71 family [Bombardia bombarda]
MASFPFARWIGAFVLFFGVLIKIQAAPTENAVVQTRNPSSNSSSNGRFVFAHFMVGIVSNRNTAADYDQDMQQAKSVGIDAFALNVGVDPYTDTQLDLAYESAANNGMKVFISFDFNWFQTTNAALVGQKIAEYASKPGQLMVDGKVFASSFSGDGLDVNAMRSAAGGVDIFWAPNFSPPGTPDSSNLDAALNWMAWPNNGQNKAPSPGANVTVQDGDKAYTNWLGSKPYIAPVSPWFSTHFGPEVSYSKNWVFPSDSLWFDRWNEILTLGPRFVEIITWNDYGESHYTTKLSSTHTDDGNSKWVNDMPHEGWLDMAKPFIAAFHAGEDNVDGFIQDDQIIYWYRPTLKSLDCDSTDTTVVTANNASGNYFEGRPDGFESMEDAVFVVSLLKSAGTVTVTSGGNNPHTYDAPSGAFAQKIPMGVGNQQFQLARDGQSVFSGTSLKAVSDHCICGIYNFNAYVGTLPSATIIGKLDSYGLASLTKGLHVTTCLPTPSLGNTEVPVAASRVIDISTTAISIPSLANPSSIPTNTATSTSLITVSTTFITIAASTATSSPSPTSSTPSSSGSCNAGTGGAGMPLNFTALCQLACSQGYCPQDVCKCTSTGPIADPQPATQRPGCVKPGVSDGYAGLCAFDCARGLCPADTCTQDCS